MIIFFGPAGAGKSVQGQLLAARYGWRWLSAGQLLRDTRDPEVMQCLQEGRLVPVETISRVMNRALESAGDIDRVILDGFPRELAQAEWLLGSRDQHDRTIDTAHYSVGTTNGRPPFICTLRTGNARPYD